MFSKNNQKKINKKDKNKRNYNSLQIFIGLSLYILLLKMKRVRSHSLKIFEKALIQQYKGKERDQLSEIKGSLDCKLHWYPKLLHTHVLSMVIQIKLIKLYKLVASKPLQHKL